MDRVPETGYAYNGDLAVAFQVLSHGPMDILVFSGAIFPMDCLDEEPLWAVYYRRLGAFARVIRFDRRGIGFSDSQPLGAPMTLEDWSKIRWQYSMQSPLSEPLSSPSRSGGA
jgi:hypothetical protein